MSSKLVKGNSAALHEDSDSSRREQILKGATTIFARNGYRNTDVQEIADFVGVGKGTIYRQFSSKQELFLATVDRGMEGLTKYTKERILNSSDPPLELLKMGIRGFMEFFDKNPELVALLVVEMAEFKDRPKTTFSMYRERDMAKNHDFFERLNAEKSVRNFPAKKLCEIIVSLLYGTIFTHYLMGDKRSLTDKAQDIIDVVIEGMLLKGSY